MRIATHRIGGGDCQNRNAIAGDGRSAADGGHIAGIDDVERDTRTDADLLPTRRTNRDSRTNRHDIGVQQPNRADDHRPGGVQRRTVTDLHRVEVGERIIGHRCRNADAARLAAAFAGAFTALAARRASG